MHLKCPSCSTTIKLDCKVKESVRRRARQPVEHTERPKSECLHSKERCKVAVENKLAGISEDDEGGREERCQTVPKSFKAPFKNGSEEIELTLIHSTKNDNESV